MLRAFLFTLGGAMLLSGLMTFIETHKVVCYQQELSTVTGDYRTTGNIINCYVEKQTEMDKKQ